MNINKIMQSYATNRDSKKGREFKHSAKQTEIYLDSFPEPEDDLQRSFFQYKCQKWDTLGHAEFIFSNLAALFILIPKYVSYRRKEIAKSEQFDAVLTMKALANRIPKEFTGTVVAHHFNSGCLTKYDSKILLRIFLKHPVSFLFLYKIMCRLACYSEMIQRYVPKIIFASAEYSFTSSILTKYCEDKGIEHSNIMHGEKYYNPREAFSRFTKFYIWDDYYRELFHALRADQTEYVIEHLKVPDIHPRANEKHCTYYLQRHTEDQLIAIKTALDNTGLNYLVRPHPLYSNGREKSIFGEDHVENNKISIWESLKTAGKAISQDSTVLFQAYQIGVLVIIDDISDPLYYTELKNRKYIMLSKPHKLLSSLSIH